MRKFGLKNYENNPMHSRHVIDFYPGFKTVITRQGEGG